MKPPHSNRSGGSGRPPSDRGPGQGPRPNGGPSRHGGQHSGGGGGQRTGGGPKGQDQRPQGQRPQSPTPQGPAQPGRVYHSDRHTEGPPRDRPAPTKPFGSQPLQARPRQDGPRPDGPRHENTLRTPRPDRHDDRQAEPVPRGTLFLYGQHAVAAALQNPARRLRRLIMTEEAEATMAERLPKPWSMVPERMDRAALDKLLGRDAVHQGVALLADPLAPPQLATTLERPGPILVLDQVTDPRNIGAILRCAAAFGVAGVITQDRNAPEETGGMAKAAAGALEIVPLIRAVNISRTLIALKAAGFWVVGLDASGTPLSGPAMADRRVALVLGAEGEGMRRLTKETCDVVAGLTMPGIKPGAVVDSLNVAAAAAVALYELGRR